MRIMLDNALSGVKAHQQRLDVESHNLANVNTPGFKASRATLAEQAGGGTEVHGIDTISDQGGIIKTDNHLDLAINGDGFFVLKDGQGKESYTRRGAFSLDAEGSLVDRASGLHLQGFSPSGELSNLRVESSDIIQLRVDKDGSVSGISKKGEVISLGQVAVARFENPGGLERTQGGGLITSANSGQAEIGLPGDSQGSIIPGSLEISNVDLVDTMVGMMVNERGVQANTATIRTADRVAGEIIDLVK